MHRDRSYTERAVAAIVQAAQAEHDFGGWLAAALASAACELGCTAALTARRPGSWEAELIQRLVHGTVGCDDEYLNDFRIPPAPGSDRRQS